MGKNVGDRVDANIYFPGTVSGCLIWQEGEPALKVKINEDQSKGTSELDDESTKRISEFDTLAEYKGKLKEDFGEGKKQDEAKRTKETKPSEGDH